MYVIPDERLVLQGTQIQGPRWIRIRLGLSLLWLPNYYEKQLGAPDRSAWTTSASLPPPARRVIQVSPQKRCCQHCRQDGWGLLS